MKGSSRRSDKQHNRRQESDTYHNVLKERPYRDTSESDHKGARREKNHSDRKGRTERVRKQDESYEELSRKKRRIESELQALDLEEQAEKRRAEEKKKSSERRRRKDPPVRVKKEPLSDDDSRRRRTKQNNGVSNEEHRRVQPSRSSEDERSWGNNQESEAKKKPKEKPDFAVSGKLAEDTNTYNGVVIKYNEPSEARKPHRRWRLYPFKGDTEMPFIPIHRQSAYLFGRTRSIADIPIDHPSCSKQHAVLQFRLLPYQRDDGSKGRRVRPYIIDLESSNGTFVNNKKIDARCYVELMEKDVVKFGFSTREYVVLHEESRNEEEDDDIVDSN